MSFPNSITLNGLTAREAVADAFYRIMAAFDDNDPTLLQSAMATDVTLNINGIEVSGFGNVKTHSFDTVAPMDTTHFVTNVRVQLEHENAVTANMTANTLAQHYPPGTGVTDSQVRLLGGSRHRIVLVKDDGDGRQLWKVKYWTMKTVWREGDTSVLRTG